jgi:hypothetical protein
VQRYPWEKSAVAESFALQTEGRSGLDHAFEFVITDTDGNERVLGHRAWNKFYKQKHKPVSSNPNLQAVVSARSNMLSRATRGDWDSRLITMPMVSMAGKWYHFTIETNCNENFNRCWQGRLQRGRPPCSRICSCSVSFKNDRSNWVRTTTKCSSATRRTTRR